MSGPSLQFVPSPRTLPADPGEGEVLMLDLAFASGAEVEQVTFPWLHRLGDRLAGWIDHHSHPEWHRYKNNPRFVLVPRQQAPACPELVTADLVRRLGTVDHVFAHADFDGCMTAAKFLKGGHEPYPGADEDARAIDSPGKGYVCSARGLRLTQAMDQARDGAQADYLDLLVRIAQALVAGEEAASLAAELDRLAQQRAQHEARLRPQMGQAERLDADVLLLRVGAEASSADRKLFLRLLEEQALVGIVRQLDWTTVATFQDDQDAGLDLSTLPGLKGMAGYAYGSTEPEALLPALRQAIGRMKKDS